MATLYEPALALRDHLAILPVLLPLIGAPFDCHIRQQTHGIFYCTHRVLSVRLLPARRCCWNCEQPPR